MAKLPSKATIATTVDPKHLTMLLIGDPKCGKSTFFSGNPKALFLCFEDGHKFIQAHKFVVTGWDRIRGKPEPKFKGTEEHGTLMEAIALLENTDQFDSVIIDTADMMAKMCSDHFTTLKGKEHISDLGDFGKGFDIGLTTPFRQATNRIAKTGRGVFYITHSKQEITRNTSGEKARKETTLPKAAAKIIVPQADVIMHIEMGKKRGRSRDRIAVCGADADVLAGNRSGRTLPERYIISPEDGWEQFEEFFTVKGSAASAEKAYAKAYAGSQ